MQISSKPQYKEVRFSSTSPKRLRPTKSFNSLTFLSWRMQHDYNANPTLRQHKQLIYIAIGLRFLLAAWHRWGVAQAGPATIRMNLKETCFPGWHSSHHPYIRCHMTWGKSYHLAPGFLQFSSCSIQECTKVDCWRLTLYQWAGLQHNRGVNRGDLHSVASEGTLKGHIRSHQVTKWKNDADGRIAKKSKANISCSMTQSSTIAARGVKKNHLPLQWPCHSLTHNMYKPRKAWPRRAGVWTTKTFRVSKVKRSQPMKSAANMSQVPTLISATIPWQIRPMCWKCTNSAQIRILLAMSSPPAQGWRCLRRRAKRRPQETSDPSRGGQQVAASNFCPWSSRL